MRTRRQTFYLCTDVSDGRGKQQKCEWRWGKTNDCGEREDERGTWIGKRARGTGKMNRGIETRELLLKALIGLELKHILFPF